VDPFTQRNQRAQNLKKEEDDATRNHDAFLRFVEITRKEQPFLRKVTDKELGGIFARLTPAEKRRYTENTLTKSTKRGSEDVARSKIEKQEKKKKREREMDDFIADEAEVEEDYISENSDDISLVSESDGDLEIANEDVIPKSKSKKQKKEKKSKAEKQPPARPPPSEGVRKFVWN
jgi:hypothetical protein